MRFLREHRCLLILNGMETVMQTGEDFGSFQGGYEGYGTLLRRLGSQNHQSCLIVISRELPKYFSVHAGDELPNRLIQVSGLELEKARSILHRKHISGSQKEEDRLIERYANHPMFVRIASGYIQQLFQGDIEQFLGREAPIAINGIRRLLDETFHRLSEQEKVVLNWIAINWEPSTEEDLRDVIHILPTRLRDFLLLLRRRSLIEVTSEGSYQLPYYIREYAINQLIEKILDEIKTGQIEFFNHYPLVQGEATDHVRAAQNRLILEPIFHSLNGNYKNLETRLEEILGTIKTLFRHQVGYAAANLLTLLKRTLAESNSSGKPTLKGYDFSGLTIKQADLRGLLLRDINFSHTDLARSVFYEPFGGILSVDLSQDGQYFAAGDASHKAYVWKLTNNQFQLHRTYAGHTHWVRAVAISPDNQYLAGGSEDHTVRVWNLQTGETLDVLRGYDRRIRSLAFDPNGQYLASGSDDGTVVLLSVKTWKRVGTYTVDSKPERRRFRTVAFSSKGDLLIAANQAAQIYLWNLKHDSELRQPRILQCQVELLRTVALHPEGEILASGGDDGVVQLWDLETEQLIHELTGHINWIRKVIFSPNGQYLASSSEDGTIRVWDIRTYDLLNVLNEHTSRVWEIAFSSDSQTLVSGSDDQQIKLWNINQGVCLTTVQGHTCKLRSVAFSADGKWLASGGDDQMIRIWEVEEGQCIKQLQGHQGRVWSVAFDDNYLVSGSDDRTVKYWNINTGEFIKNFTDHTSWVRTVAISPHHKLIASGGDDKVIRVFDLETFQSRDFEAKHTDWIISLVFSPDGQFIVSSSDDRTVRIWNVETGKCIYPPLEHGGAVRAVAISPDGQWIASGSNDRTVKLFKLHDPQHDVLTLNAHSDWVRCVAFHPKCPVLASGSYDQKVILWNIESGELVRSLKGHEAAVISVAFSPKGDFLATGSEDETIRLWEVETGNIIKTLRIPRPYENVRITDAIGLTREQKARLIALGAVE